ncbi:hypothetical protein C8046_00020 [Serinibacter arcticus]|uniref:Cellulase n=1 Tax=Serinibacter arcticus TaxID=1655435 RepID=A0A2U2A0A5_9MICO|nr:hypothetical protein C8046_00020 [Serinibacter arcticus]
MRHDQERHRRLRDARGGVGDAETFDATWTWTRDNLQRADGLLSWRWADGAVVDDEPASDADLDAARALVLAGERFDEPAYTEAATALGQAVLDSRPRRRPSAGSCSRARGPTSTPTRSTPATPPPCHPAARRARRRPALGRARRRVARRHRGAHHRRHAAAELGPGARRRRPRRGHARSGRSRGALRVRRRAHPRAVRRVLRPGRPRGDRAGRGRARAAGGARGRARPRRAPP